MGSEYAQGEWRSVHKGSVFPYYTCKSSSLKFIINSFIYSCCHSFSYWIPALCSAPFCAKEEASDARQVSKRRRTQLVKPCLIAVMETISSLSEAPYHFYPASVVARALGNGIPERALSLLSRLHVCLSASRKSFLPTFPTAVHVYFTLSGSPAALISDPFLKPGLKGYVRSINS